MTTNEQYIVYATNPEMSRFDSRDKRFATAMCIFTIITSAVLISLFFLIGDSFKYILLIIILMIGISVFIAFRMGKPRLWFGPATTVKVPTAVQVHILPDNNTTHSGYYQSQPQNNAKNLY